MGALVRSMNCYYSNLIEGHDTHPRDIDRALANDFSAEPRKRELQQEAVAHIHVQRLIDEGRDPDIWPATADYARWLHREFCALLPAEMLWVNNPDTGERVPVIPGELRDRHVIVGRHVPPDPEDLTRFLDRFDRAYASPPLSQLRQIQAVGAVHHRFLWIHPFIDGNGRVARLMSHALLKRLGIGTSLWSVARGLARDEARYKALLMHADGPREGDRDGRGNLTQRGLMEFCQFFLDRAIDQVRESPGGGTQFGGRSILNQQLTASISRPAPPRARRYCIVKVLRATPWPSRRGSTRGPAGSARRTLIRRRKGLGYE